MNNTFEENVLICMHQVLVPLSLSPGLLCLPLASEVSAISFSYLQTTHLEPELNGALPSCNPC